MARSLVIQELQENKNLSICPFLWKFDVFGEPNYLLPSEQLLKHVFWYIFTGFYPNHMIKNDFESAD